LSGLADIPLFAILNRVLSIILLLLFFNSWSWAGYECASHEGAFNVLTPLIPSKEQKEPITWVLLQNKNFQISDSCFSSIGAERVVRLMEESMNQGLKCLKKLGTPKADEHYKNLLKLLSNKTNIAKLRCDIDDERKKKNFNDNTYAAATLVGDNDYPTVFMNPNDIRNGKFLHTDDQLKFIFFHEFMHTIAHGHSHNFYNYRDVKVDYAATCDVCCFGPQITAHVESSFSEESKRSFCKICRGDFDTDRIAYFHAFTSGLSENSAQNFIRMYVHKDMLTDLMTSENDETTKKLLNLSRHRIFNEELVRFLKENSAKKKEIQNFIKSATQNFPAARSFRAAQLMISADFSEVDVCAQLKKQSASFDEADFRGFVSTLNNQKSIPTCLGNVMTTDKLNVISEANASQSYRDFVSTLSLASNTPLENEDDFIRRLLKVNPSNRYVMESSSLQLGRLIMTRPISIEQRKSILEDFFANKKNNSGKAVAVVAGLLIKRNSQNMPDNDFKRTQELILESVNMTEVFQKLEQSNLAGNQHKAALLELQKWPVSVPLRQKIEQRLSQSFFEGI
tara:strand:- start:31555 stop:33252 length:1698 start_codon:yes stop_codon:yes gene_type:complete